MNQTVGPKRDYVLLAAPLLFFGGGCAALLYEIIWLQLLQLVIGLTTVSLALLLGVYMGGMCLGSMLFPRWVSARQHPLRVYALLELGIGIMALLVWWGLPGLTELYVGKGGAGVVGLLFRCLVAALCLLPPTVLMGATLPAVSRWVESTPQGISWLGFLYGSNILGGVCGCLLGGFYLLRVHDMGTATYVGAAINGLVALMGLACSMKMPGGGEKAMAKQGEGARIPGNWVVYGVIGLSGFTALGAEVVWTRVLSLSLGATVYTFSIILAVFLVGLGLGSWVGASLLRGVLSPRVALGVCQGLLILAVAWAAYAITQSLPYWPVNPALSPSPWHIFQLDMARCFWAILPAAVLWGASFPLALAGVAGSGEDLGRLVGNVYTANTVGAILGTLVFSLVVVPVAGTQWAERALIAIPALAAGAILVCGFPRKAAQPSTAVGTPGGGRGVGLVGGLAGLVAMAAWLAWSTPVLPWGVIAHGRYLATYGNRLAPGIIDEQDVPRGAGRPDTFCTYMGEGLNGSVVVSCTSAGVRNFHSAGKVQASNDSRDMRLQRMLGHLSALGHARPESVLVVACGAGVTAGSFVPYPSIERIVICDIEPLVPKFVAPRFEKENHAVMKDPRTEVVIDDGRHFVRTTREKFDIITSDPIDPWVKGCASLNTVEYYEACKAHLKPGGVMSLWIPLYECDQQTAKSLIATFFQVFPHGILWSNDNDGEGYDAVLFGQTDPIRMNVEALQTRLKRTDYSGVRQSLADVGFHSVVSLLATYAGRAEDLGPWLSGAQINTDRNLRLQYLAGMWYNSYQSSDILDGIRKHYTFPDTVFVGADSARLMVKYAIEGPPSP